MKNLLTCLAFEQSAQYEQEVFRNVRESYKREDGQKTTNMEDSKRKERSKSCEQTVLKTGVEVLARKKDPQYPEKRTSSFFCG